jgi:hypothetical protein
VHARLLFPGPLTGVQRTGQRHELLAGPAFYGLAHTVLTLLAWRGAPAVAGIAALCAGGGRSQAGLGHGAQQADMVGFLLVT